MICSDPKTRILAVVSTFNRKDLTGLCLSSLSRAKSPWTQVVVLDDASTEYGRDYLDLWGFPVHRRIKGLGVGAAARARLQFFLEIREEFQLLIACDNDLQFADLFDLRLRSLWEKAREDRNVPTVLSGFRSVSYDATQDFVGYSEVVHVGGACQFMDRATAQFLTDTLSPQDWSGAWDTAVSNTSARKIVPRQSLVQHCGAFGNGHNGRSWDIAADCVPTI